MVSYPLAAQTNTTTYTRVSKYFENSSQNPLYSSPSVLPGSTERFKLLINYADNIPIGSHSDWRIYRPSAGTTADTFTLSGQNLSSLEEGTPYLTDSLNIPSDDWQVEVKVSNSSHEIRIFNILLLRLDEIQ